LVRSFSFCMTFCLIAWMASTSSPSSPFGKKSYSASIRDSVVITSPILFNGPAGSVIAASSDPLCLIVSRGDGYIFYAPKVGEYRMFFSSRSAGSLYLDTLAVMITDQPPQVKVGTHTVFADINQLFSFDLNVQDDGDSVRVMLDLDGDGKCDTSICGVSNPYFRYSRPTRIGEREKIFQSLLTVLDNDSHAFQDTVMIHLYFKPPCAKAGDNIIACANEPVDFSGRMSHDENGYISKYIWDLNADGKADTVTPLPDLRRAFGALGDFSVILKVVDNDNNISLPDTIVLSVFKDKPSLAITAPHEAKREEEISFVGTGKINCGVLEKYFWDFDGNGKWDYVSRTHGRAYHAYKELGAYPARFMVLDNRGDSTSLTWPVNILP
jgi:hypothetical protein